MRPGSGLPTYRNRKSARLTPLVTSAAVLALLGGLAVQPGSVPLRAEPTGNTYDWREDTAAEQLRQDQCLMSDVLRLGGPAMTAAAQDGLNQPAATLHELADRTYWRTTPLGNAYEKDRAAAAKELAAIYARRDAWQKPLAGLTSPAGFTEASFHKPPGSTGSDEKDFTEQTGLAPWIGDRYWKEEKDFYEESTPPAGTAARKAVSKLGTPLYGTEPDPRELSGEALARAEAEHAAFKYLISDSASNPTGADDARQFLSAGGFTRTAPAPGTPEFRIAVEDLKTRFSTCAWRDPLDPANVLDGVTKTAAAEWQREISAQAAPRNQILDTNQKATKALADGAQALSEMLGHSWVADHLARWKDYWKPGGIGWVGDKPAVIEVRADRDKCLDVQNASTANGTPVQVYACNGSAAQQWRLEGDALGLHLRNVRSSKCLDVAGADNANGTAIQIWTCNSTPAQTWEYTTHTTTHLKNTGTGKCLDLRNFNGGSDARLWTCQSDDSQRFVIVPSGHNGEMPSKADFDQADEGIADAQAGAKKQLAVLKARAATATDAAEATDTAAKKAYAIADDAGAPRGRGLLVGQQKAQVTKGAAAALEAMVKAGETAEAATRASAGDSETITQRALAQAAQSKAEFRKEAARMAAEQAEAAAESAKEHRDNAKKSAETAKAKLGEAVEAEADAKAAAAQAHAKRRAAEAEEATAKAEKATAAAKQAEAAEHKKNAETYATQAQAAGKKADAAATTASQKRSAAEKARDNAKTKRDDAWNAEQKANAARAKADAKAAYAASLDAGTEADAARTAANQADTYATQAETAAGKARGEADAATKAASDADAAATRAEAAAKRSRSDADAAQAEKLKADAAVRTATSAAADALAASQDAAREARAAVTQADTAEQKAKDAKSQADKASDQADKALAASAKATGYAHVTAQAAVDAGKAAKQVAKPANDAIQLGSPYITTDSAAGLVVLTGQGSKTIAEQQEAVADAHAKNAQEEAEAAKELADAAKGDTKAAYAYAAKAAEYAATARTYAKAALGYSADASTYAAKAAASLARTIGHDRDATADALAADKAAGRAEGYAKAARESADQAALDAQAARAAAAAATTAAQEARKAADRAAADATAAEQAAKDAEKYAKEAQEAADRAEKASKAKQINTGTVPDAAGASIGNMFYLTDRTEQIGEPQTLKKTDGCEGWIDALVYKGDCTLTVKIRYKAFLDLYLCTAEILDPTKATCPADETVYLGEYPTDELSQEITHNITIGEYQAGVDPVDILFGHWIKCVQLWPGGQSGSWGGCGWAGVDVALLFSGKILRPIADGIAALDAAMRTGIGIADAARALKSLRINPQALAAIEYKANMAEAIFTSCRTNSFPGHTSVLMADGSHRPISMLRVGDAVLAGDPATGTARPEPVTDTFQHPADKLVTISLADGSSLDTTPGHKIYAKKRGWVLASELRAGDWLFRPDGEAIAVTGVRGETDAFSQEVYDLTVSGLHTFYVRAEGSKASDVLVHNCLNLSDELLPNLRKFRESGEMHALQKHVTPTPEEAFELARKTGKPNTIWTSQEIAQQAIERVVADHFSTIKNGRRVIDQAKWKAFEKTVAAAPDGSLVLDTTGRWTAYPSLGKVYHADGVTVTNAGNGVRVKLLRVKSHRGQGRGGFAIMTAYPTGVAP
ncbi:RICIN domain-containing protein [Streptomyces sp. NPDC101118]|uniref:RICIN domain-containing protein n=1 Tax=Streptomyces sp. NPDC101118 TaxID=3366109 RepID=UPI0037FFB949